ncbi:MAG: ISAs1 family transposase [Chloroflexota bacterium]|nr:ISAs1 family transposase [Chloroflexota bacterium]
MDPITFTVTPLGQDRTLTINLTDLLTHLQAVPDHRKRRGVRYPLAVLLAIAVLAKLSGQSQVHALAGWAQERAAELAAVFGLPRARMPHPTTWTRVLGMGVTAAAVEAALQPLLLSATNEVPARASRHVALDGKTLRGTVPLGATRGVHLVTAYHVERGTPLRQRAVEAKANELVVAPQILADLDLQGTLVTGDAMFAQRNLSTQIVEAGGDYLWLVKDNQRTLLDDLRLLFGPQPAALPGTSPIPDDFVTVRTVEKAHGRLDERVLTISSLLTDYQPWPYLAQAFHVVRTSRRGRRKTCEVRYGITSVPAASASAGRILAVVRGHWQIENGLHYRRDVTLAEDASLARLGQAPHVLATLNNFVCAVTAQAGIPNLAALQRSMAAAVDRWLFRH